MEDMFLEIQQSPPLAGTVSLLGAKNAVLVIMASLILTRGVSRLSNVPASSDVLQMIKLLESLGASITFDTTSKELSVDTTDISKWCVKPEIMKKMRASVLVMGPLLARFSRADIALPGGCVIGSRPIDLHVSNLQKMGVEVEIKGSFLTAYAKKCEAQELVLGYPSVGATENLLMMATAAEGATKIVNAALEPEVLDLIDVLKKMGAAIRITPPATIEIEGGKKLAPIEHEILVDRLEAGSILIAAAATGGSVTISNARADHLSVFLLKLQEMGHAVSVGANNIGITFSATKTPQAVSFKTSPYPGFPTDLQAPMMVLQCLASGQSVVDETVYENRLLHTRELQKMGAVIAEQGSKATITGVDELYGSHVIATDIRASCALAIAGLAAKGTTVMTGLSHWKRGYDGLEKKLALLGGRISLKAANHTVTPKSEETVLKAS